MRPLSSTALAAALVALAVAPAARADTLLAPVGGRSLRLPGDRVFCDTAVGNAGWTIDADGHTARPPALDSAVGVVTAARIAPTPAQCANSTATISLVATAPLPAVDANSIVVDVDAGEATVRGRNLRDTTMRWRSGSNSGEDRCPAPQTSNGIDTCTFAIARGLPSDSTQIEVSVLPAGVRPDADSMVFDASGRRLANDEWTYRPARVVVAAVVPAGASIDTASGAARVRLLHADSVATVECTDAVCDVEGDDLVVRDEHGGNDALEAHLHLRPHVFVRTESGFDPNPIVSLPLQRCPVTVASAPPLRGVRDQNIVLRVGGTCARDRSLRFATADGATTARLADVVDEQRYVVVPIARVETDEIAIDVRREGTVVAVAHVRTARAPSPRIRLELDDHGAIDFIPTNRDARVLLPVGVERGHLVPVAVEGVYTVARDAGGHDTIRGVDGTAGSVAIRMAYRDPSLPPGLRNTDLAILTEPVDRSIHAANVPVAILGNGSQHDSLVEMLCGDGLGHVRSIAPGVTASVSFRARQTCRLVMHRERLRPEDGAQAIHLGVDVIQVDGVARSDAHIDQVIVLRPEREPRTLYLSGVQSPFDRVIVRISLAADDTHWAIAPDERTGAPQAQWSIVMGTDRFRIFGSTAIPTGLFRVSDDYGRGIMTLNAGAIFRVVWLSNEGHESPIGLEGGVIWTGIAGTSATQTCPGNLCNSPIGEVAVVTGIGLGVPIANQGHATQTSINVHAWLEYEVSRAARGPGAGSPWGFVFGPSISIGDVGANF